MIPKVVIIFSYEAVCNPMFETKNQVASSIIDRLQTLRRTFDSPKWTRTFQRAPKYLMLAFALLALSTLADITWLLIPQPVLQQNSPGHQITMSTNNSSPGLALYSASQINRWNLFGRFIKNEPKKTTEPIVAKTVPINATKLNLTLKGITHSAHANESFAIIVDMRGKQKNYKIGDTVPGNAKIEQILVRSVILLHNNQRVKLVLKKRNR